MVAEKMGVQVDQMSGGMILLRMKPGRYWGMEHVSALLAEGLDACLRTASEILIKGSAHVNAAQKVGFAEILGVDADSFNYMVYDSTSNRIPSFLESFGN